MRPRQTLLLGLLLLVPVLAFLFLYRFGSNRYALPTFLPDRVDSTQVGGKWRRDTVFHRLAPFRLRSSAGRGLSSAELAGGLYVAQFYEPGKEGSARVSRQLRRVQERYRDEPRVRILSFVLNPGPQSPVTLERLAEQYGTVAGKWYFLGGAPDSLRAIYHEEFRADQPYQRIVQGHRFMVPPAADRLYLVDREQRVRGLYDGLDGRELDRLLTEINVLLYTYDHNR